jgi:hypothetical protein
MELIMHITIDNASQFRDQFRSHGRQDQFSYEGLGFLFDYLEEIAPEYELDVIALCCEYYEDMPVDIAENYGIELDENDSEGRQAQQVKDFLESETIMVGVTSSGSIVYAVF